MGSDQTKKQSSHEDFLLPLKQRGIIDQPTYEMGRLLVKYLQNKQYEQLKQYFRKKTVKAEPCPPFPPICRRLIKKEEVCYECKTCQYMHGQYFCEECFQKELHIDHDVHAIDGKMAKCECGDDQILDENFFCKRHSKDVPILGLNDLQLQKETKFLTQLLIFLKINPRASQSFKISQEGIERLGENLLTYLNFMTKGPRNQTAVAQALLDKMNIMVTSQIKLHTSGNSILEELILVFCEIKATSNMIADVTNQIYWASSISKEILRIFYRALLLGNTTNIIPNYFTQIKHPFLRCYKSHLQYFSDRSNARIFLNRGYQASQLENEYLTFYDAVLKILDFKNHAKIVANIMSETPFSKLFNYQFQGANFVEPINKLTLPAFYLARRLIKAVKDKQILKAIAVNTLQALSKKSHPNFDLIFERSFALALYHLYDYRIPSRGELLAFFSQIKKSPQQLILMFWQAKDKYLNLYNKLIVHNKKGEGCPNATLLATDQLYIRILCSLMASNQEVSALYDGFIMGRVHHTSQPFKGMQQIKQKITSTEVLKSRLHQLSTFINLFGGSLNSNLCELIVRSSQGNDKEPLQQVLTYLSLIFQGSNAADFKNSAQRFASHEEVATFIKERLLLEGKKIRCKGEIKSSVSLFPFSEYFPDGLSQLSLERMTAINFQAGKQHKNIFVQQECLRHLMVLLYACLLYIEETPAVQNEVQEELQSILKSILGFSGEKRSKEFLALVQRIYARINNCPPALDSITKKTLQACEKIEGANEEGDNARNNKKKQKMQELKSKQKNLLQAFHVQEQKRVTECIICKNSKAGNPLLLGNFGYKNIFSQVLKGERPFMEFSSCGHFIHTECLQQEANKGQFKIWYPCILCKTISNILLPSVPNSENETDIQFLTRVMAFLPNFAGIYTFFYKDRKELMEFEVEKAYQVFPLLFKTLVYEITFYPILNLPFFQRSQLPVTRLIYDILEYTHRLNGFTIAKKEQIKGDPFFAQVYSYVFDQLHATIRRQGHRGAESNLPKDVSVMLDEIIYMLSQRDLKMQITPKNTKEYREKVVNIFLRPPQDLRELQRKPQQCASCQKVVQNYESCLLCNWACCSKCNQVKKVHALQAHLSESVFLRNANGKYTYVHEELLGEFNSLYVDYLGEEYNRTEKAAKGEYMLSKEKWEGVVEDLLSNRIHREVMKFQ